MPFNLLDDALLPGIDDGKAISMTLPGLFSLWGAGRFDLYLGGVRRHQRAALHMFLCQIGASAWNRSTDGHGIDADESVWKMRLIGIAPLNAWSLVQELDDLPAFMQAPIPDTDFEGKIKRQPDSLGILVTSKNHVVKQEIIGAATPWMWALALIEIQTMSGWGGRNNYGTVRMNGGQASRPMVAVYSDMREGARWCRDVSILKMGVNEIHGDCPDGFYADPGKGIVATWVLPWDGESKLDMSELDPLFVEVTRRIRLRVVGGCIEARVGNSFGQRVNAAKELCGMTGDPWAPISGKTKVLTVPAAGWSLRRLNALVTPGADAVLKQSFLQRVLPTDTDSLFFHASVVTGGQGKTEGLHEVTIQIPPRAVGLLGKVQSRATLGQLSASMLSEAEEVSRILRKAILCFSQGGVNLKDLKGDKPEAGKWISSFQKDFTDAFFPSLWAASEGAGPEAWQAWLRVAAAEAYEDAAKTLPIRSELFFRAHSRGNSVLFGLLKKLFQQDDSDDKNGKKSP